MNNKKDAARVVLWPVVRHYTVHWETPNVFGFSPVQAASKRDARRKYLDQHPASTITKVHEGPVIFKFKYA